MAAQLVSMGFPLPRAENALAQTNGDLEAALELMLAELDTPQPAAAQPAAAPAAPAVELPARWEASVTPDGTPYYIDHNKGVTRWDPPGPPARVQQPQS